MRSPSRFLLAICLTLFLTHSLPAQTGLKMSNPAADSVLRGYYDPAAYMASSILNHPDDIVPGVRSEVNADSLRKWLDGLTSFKNRNSGSDTLSSTKGIGAARTWAMNKMQEFSARNENRLQAGYFEFDRVMCSTTHHKNVVGVLPGMDTANREIIILEGHMDSRCAGLCDTACAAYGADDDGSGCALVMELARVLSKYSFNQTIVFMLVTGEEQGLYGSDAFSDFCLAEGIKVKAVLNNDIVGGIICGNTASPPGCPGAGEIDSLNVRLFSYGGFNSLHKGLVRFLKLEYLEEVTPFVTVPLTLNIMNNEDRTGRSGDHRPFREKNFTAMRFTSANEHGAGDPSVPGYTDHQHTSADSIGVDTDMDGVIDSLWVDFHYLARNAVMNGVGAGLLAIGPLAPDHSVVQEGPDGMIVTILTATGYDYYRVGLRSTTNDFDTVYTMTGTVDTLYGLTPGTTYVVSAASVDTNGIESKFTKEVALVITGTQDVVTAHGIELLPNHPNPFDENTTITVRVDQPVSYHKAYIRVDDAQGREVERLPVELKKGMNEVVFYHGFHATGMYLYSLVLDDEVLATRSMIFVN